MARKLTLALSLLLLVGLMTGVSFANAVQITLGPSYQGTITTSPSFANFSNVSGFAYQGTGTGTYGFINGFIPVTGQIGSLYTLAPNAEAVTVSIGPDTMGGSFELTAFAQLSNSIAAFVGTFTVSSATSGFQSDGFRPGVTVDADFVTYNGHMSSGEIVAPVPEPASFALVGSGLLALAGMLRRKL
jgi:hypothetical protein